MPFISSGLSNLVVKSDDEVGAYARLDDPVVVFSVVGIEMVIGSYGRMIFS